MGKLVAQTVACNAGDPSEPPAFPYNFLQLPPYLYVPLWSPSPPAPNPSQHQGLFQ